MLFDHLYRITNPELIIDITVLSTGIYLIVLHILAKHNVPSGTKCLYIYMSYNLDAYIDQLIETRP